VDPANPDKQKKINECTDPESIFYKTGKTSCCFGECYDERCYECDLSTKKLKPKFDEAYQGCCQNAGIYHMDQCQSCREINDTISIIINECTDAGGSGFLANKKQCCPGNKKPGECFNDSCAKCDFPNYALEAKCPPEPGSVDTECCGDICWDPTDQCKKCEEYTVQINGVSQIQYRLVSKTIDECPKCCGKICCQNASDECCHTYDTTGIVNSECYNPKCEECIP
jgi:hypothetical protein